MQRASVVGGMTAMFWDNVCALQRGVASSRLGGSFVVADDVEKASDEALSVNGGDRVRRTSAANAIAPAAALCCFAMAGAIA